MKVCLLLRRQSYHIFKFQSTCSTNKFHFCGDWMSHNTSFVHLWFRNLFSTNRGQYIKDLQDVTQNQSQFLFGQCCPRAQTDIAYFNSKHNTTFKKGISFSQTQKPTTKNGIVDVRSSSKVQHRVIFVAIRVKDIIIMLIHSRKQRQR